MNELSALMKSGLLTILMSFVFVISANGQSIWTNPITGTDPGLSNPYTTGDVFDANITVAGIGRGAGVNGNAGNDRYNTNSWNTAAIDLTAYFEFTLTPNAGCEIDFVSFVYTSQRSNVSIANFAFRSSVDGFTSDIGAPDFDGITIDLSAGAYQNITTAITFRFYAWGASASGNTFSINDFTFNGTVTCGCSGPVAEPTTETTGDAVTVTCTSATISWTASTTADDVIVVVSTGAISDTPTDGVNYTASAAFGSGEELVLTDAQFVVYNGSGTSVTVSGLVAGTNYNYAIFGYDGVIVDCEENYLTGGNFGSFTTATGCTDAQITTIMVNSCNGVAEGTDELIIVENGSEPINIDDMTIYLPNSTWCNSGCGTNTIVNNATYLADLNTMAGCIPDLFVYADPIPAGATIIIFTGDPPSTTLDYSSNCGAPGAPMYVLFLNNNSITGNFANSGATPKITTIDFGNGQSDVVTYLPDDVDQNDGGSVLFDDAGTPTYYTSTDCVYPLSARLATLSAAWNETVVDVEWSSYTESGMGEYLVQRSVDGYTFETIGTVMITGSTDQTTFYSFTDFNPIQKDVVYYRLALVNEGGVTSHSGIVSVFSQNLLVTYNNQQITISQKKEDTKPATVNIYALDGNLVFSGKMSQELVIPFTYRGIYLVEIPEFNYRQKIVCL